MKLWMLPALLMSMGPSIWDFEKDELDKEPVGFEFATTKKGPAGKWLVKSDVNTQFLAQVDMDPTDNRFTMAIVKDSSYRDLVVSAKIMAVSGKVDQAGGLVWRYKDCDNYYLARLNALEHNVYLFRVVNGNRTRLKAKEELKFKTDKWYVLRVEHKGTSIKVYLNGENLLEAEDKAFSDAGKIGVWTKSDSVTYFDDLTVEAIP